MNTKQNLQLKVEHCLHIGENLLDTLPTTKCPGEPCVFC